MTLQIQTRARVRDLSRDNRCYNGAYASNDFYWSEWVVLERDVAPDEVDRNLELWRDLNDFAVNARGESAKKEFRVVEVTDAPAT